MTHKKAADCGNSLTAHSYNTHRNSITQFRDAMRAAGIAPPDVIEADGSLHRYRIEGDKGGSRNGWYCLHLNDRPAGVFGNWKTSQSEKWKANGEPMTDAERVSFAAMIQAAKLKADAERRASQDDAATVARSRWISAAPANKHHPYLVAKGVQAHGLRQHGPLLLVPLIDVHGRLHSLQTIGTDGQKRFISGGRIAGTFSSIGEWQKPDRVLICEGFATGATLHEETGSPVLCAMNAGNLLAVAKAAREAWPSAEIVICADDDRHTPGNPGITKATEAANEIGAKLAVPQFPEGEAGTDFNDMRNVQAVAV